MRKILYIVIESVDRWRAFDEKVSSVYITTKPNPLVHLRQHLTTLLLLAAISLLKERCIKVIPVAVGEELEVMIVITR